MLINIELKPVSSDKYKISRIEGSVECKGLQGWANEFGIWEARNGKNLYYRFVTEKGKFSVEVGSIWVSSRRKYGHSDKEIMNKAVEYLQEKLKETINQMPGRQNAYMLNKENKMVMDFLFSSDVVRKQKQYQERWIRVCKRIQKQQKILRALNFYHKFGK